MTQEENSDFQPKQRSFDPMRPEDRMSNVTANAKVGEGFVELIQSRLNNQDRETIPTPQGPILSLYAGEAGAERKLLGLLPLEQQKLVAVDYNPHLTSDDERIEYHQGDVLRVLPTLETASFGMITIFGADRSIEENEWPEIWRQIDRLLKQNGYILILPKANTEFMPQHFHVVRRQRNLWIIAFKGE